MGYLMLIALNSLDFITGLIASKLEHKAITSRKAKQGILRKCAEWAAVACAFVCEFVAGDLLGINFPAAPVVVCWLSVCEIISICENLGRAGIKIPAKWLNQLRDATAADDKRGEGDNAENENNTDSD